MRREAQPYTSLIGLNNHLGEYKVLETLEEATVKEKHFGSSFIVFHACNGQHE